MDFNISDLGVLLITIIVCSSGISAILTIKYEDLQPLSLFLATIAFILFYCFLIFLIIILIFFVSGLTN